MGTDVIIVTFIAVLSAVLHTLVSACSVEVYGVRYRREVQGRYALMSNTSCHGKSVWRGSQYYIHFLDEYGSTGLRGWIISSMKCGSSSYLLVANDDPSAPAPQETRRYWKEFLSSSFYTNPWMGVRCEGTLTPYMIFFIVLGSIIGVCIILGVVYKSCMCIRKKRQQNQQPEQPPQTNIPLSDVDDGFQDYPPPDLVMDAPHYMEAPPAYEDIFGTETGVNGRPLIPVPESGESPPEYSVSESQTPSVTQDNNNAPGTPNTAPVSEEEAVDSSALDQSVTETAHRPERQLSTCTDEQPQTVTSSPEADAQGLSEGTDEPNATKTDQKRVNISMESVDPSQNRHAETEQGVVEIINPVYGQVDKDGGHVNPAYEPDKELDFENSTNNSTRDGETAHMSTAL